MRNFICLLILSISLSANGQEKVGNYKKSTLPKGFNYNIVRDKSNAEKNELHIVINMKLSVSQIATLASELYNTKEHKPRFYIYYHYFLNVKPGNPWATSNFEPKLRIKILE